MTKNMLALFSPFQSLPVASVVAVLKSVHEQNLRPGGASRDSQRVATDDVAPGVLPDLAPLLAAFTLLHGKLGGADLDSRSYEQVCRRFHELQTQLRRQKMAIERLVGQTLAGKDADDPRPPAFQQTLHLQCARGAATSGRFRVVNRTGRNARYRVTVEHVIGDETGRIENASLSFSPERGQLAADEARGVQATLDLTRCRANPDRHVDAAASVFLDDDLCLKLWIAVDVHDAD
jgi:hypothetical protein